MNHSFPIFPIIILIFTLSIILLSIYLYPTTFSLCFHFNTLYYSHSIFWHSHILSTLKKESICLSSPTDPPYTTYLPSLLLYHPYFDSTPPSSIFTLPSYPLPYLLTTFNLINFISAMIYSNTHISHHSLLLLPPSHNNIFYYSTLYILKPYPPRHLSPCTNLCLFLQLFLYNKDNHMLYFFTFYISTRHSLFSRY